MGKPPAFQFYANDWLSSTTIALMSVEEERGYLRLLLHAWNSGDCCLPDDDEVLARLSLMNEKWMKGSSNIVRKCFIPNPDKPDTIINEKLYSVWLEQTEWRKKCSIGGKKSAKSRKQSGCQKGVVKKRRVVARPLEVKGQVNGNTSVFSLQSSTSDSELQSSESSTGFANAKPRASNDARPAKKSPVDRSEEVRAVFDHYRAYHQRAFPKPKSGSKEWAKVRARLEDGYTVEQLQAAIDGCHRSPWHCGENPGGKLYQSLELIVRDASHVNQFLEAADHNPPVLSEKETRGQRAAQSWVERMKKCDQKNDLSSQA